MDHRISMLLKEAVVAAVAATLVFATAAFAAQPGANANLQQSAAEQTDESGLEPRLQTVKKDLLVFLNFAEHFIAGGETKTAAQLQAPLDDYLRRHADYLMTQAAESPNNGMTQLSAEITLIKLRLLIVLNYRDDANTVLADMKTLYAPYQKMSVQVFGRTTTLDEAIRQLDSDLARLAATRK